MSQKAKTRLLSALTNVFTVLATLTIAIYLSELILHITLPVWVHWSMPSVVANWVRAIDN